MKTQIPEEIEKEIFEELFDNGDLIDDDFTRFYKRHEGIISGRIDDYHSQHTLSREKIVDLLATERKRCKDIAYSFYDKYNEESKSLLNVGGDTNKMLAERRKQLGDIARQIGNTISGNNALTPQTEKMSDRIKIEYANALASPTAEKDDKKEILSKFASHFNNMVDINDDPELAKASNEAVNELLRSGDKVEPGKQEDRTDLKQYMTNLLYAAYDKGYTVSIKHSELDEWVEEMINGIDAYFKSQPHPVPTDEITGK